MTGPDQAAPSWCPAASPARLRLRADILARIRSFFARLGVLEVDTPVMSAAATTDPAIQSFQACSPGSNRPDPVRYLHTSPEFAMKRLLAAGSGDIYQLCKVFRDGECGTLHNPEFTLLEWYRTGFDHFDLMDEVEHLLVEVLAGLHTISDVSHWTYRDLFIEIAGIDPFVDDCDAAIRALQRHGHAVPIGMQNAQHDDWLDLLMTHVIQPRMGDGLLFVRDYPASQASLARLRSGNPVVAARFEVFLDSIEIGNGFHELTDADEQRQRFAADLEQRNDSGLPGVPVDENLLAALRAGLPDCAGVALGVDRLIMMAAGAIRLDEVIAFPVGIA